MTGIELHGFGDEPTARASALGAAVTDHLTNRSEGGPMGEPIVYFRAFPAELQQSGERQLTGRLVPYDVVADVLDKLPDGRVDIYREGFRRGAFDGQVLNGPAQKRIFTKIGLIHRHEGGLGYLGPFVGLRDQPDGLWGDVMVLPTKADDVSALLRAGVDELSVEFRLRLGDNTETVDGVRWRTKVHLDRVALEPQGAYSSAQVLAYRAERDELEAEQAKVDAAAEAEAAATDAARAAADAEAAEALERKRRFDEMVARLGPEQERQHQLVREYGVTQPGGFGTVHR